MFKARSGEQLHPSFLAICTSMAAISSVAGAETLIPKQRERTGSIILEGELQTRIILHDDEYFSIVLRRAAIKYFIMKITNK
jgi:hypothetical protein